MVRTLLYMAVCVPALALGQTDSVQNGRGASTSLDTTGIVAPSGADSAREMRMDGREVVAARRDVPGSVRVIGREELSRSFGLSEVLGREPGTLVRSFGGGLGNYSVLSLRGAPSEQVEVLVDGVPMGGSAGSSVDVGPFALDGLERVELRQAGAIGSDGAPRLDLVSRKGWARWGGSARVGSFGERGGSAWWGSPGGKLSTAAWYETARNDYSFKWDNGTEYNKSDDRIRKLSNNDFTGWGAAVAVRPSESWDATARATSTDRGVTSLYLPDARARWERADLSGRIAYHDEGEWGRSGEASWRQGVSTWTDSDRTSGYLADRKSEESLQDGSLRLGLARTAKGWFDPRVSVSGRWESSNRVSLGRQDVQVTPRGSRVSAGGGIGWSGRQGDLAGAELDLRVTGMVDRRNFSKELGGVQASSRNDKKWLSERANARVWWGIGSGAAAWISGSYLERAPDFSEWMGSTGGVLPSLDLEPEASRHGELGMEWARGWLRLSASGWMADYEDPIRAETQGGSPLVVYRNGPGMSAYGLDAKLHLCERLASFSVATTLQNARISDPNPALDGNVPKRTPSAKVSLQAQFGPWHGVAAGWTLDAQGSTWASDMDSKDDFRPSWAMHGLWLRWRRGAASVSFLAKNLGDVQLPDQEDMPMQGRQFLVRMDLDFSAGKTEEHGSLE